MTAWADHGADGNGEPLAIVLRPGTPAPTPPPTISRPPGSRSPSCPATCGARCWSGPIPAAGRTSSSVADREIPAAALLRGHDHHRRHAGRAPESPRVRWTPAYDGDGQVRDGAWVADITGLLDTGGWPAGLRVIVRKERPHPGRSCGSPMSTARFTAFATDAKRGQLADWNCATQRARCEDRIRCAKTPGCGTCHSRVRPEPAVGEIVAWPAAAGRRARPHRQPAAGTQRPPRVSPSPACQQRPPPAPALANDGPGAESRRGHPPAAIPPADQPNHPDRREPPDRGPPTPRQPQPARPRKISTTPMPQATAS